MPTGRASTPLGAADAGTTARPEALDETVRAFGERRSARTGARVEITRACLGSLRRPDPAETLALFDEVQLS
ncbi:hypothetical protein Srut_21290 [Streptomyces rutgersensis]|nr:hypothetical protein Srut_21290 [Streptomyces rutgersensis]